MTLGEMMTSPGYGAYGDEAASEVEAHMKSPSEQAASILQETKTQFTKLFLAAAAIGFLLYIKARFF